MLTTTTRRATSFVLVLALVFMLSNASSAIAQEPVATLRFAWPVPATAIVTTTTSSTGLPTSSMAYRLDAVARGDHIAIARGGGRLLSMAGADPEETTIHAEVHGRQIKDPATIIVDTAGALVGRDTASEQWWQWIVPVWRGVPIQNNGAHEITIKLSGASKHTVPATVRLAKPASETSTEIHATLTATLTDAPAVDWIRSRTDLNQPHLGGNRDARVDVHASIVADRATLVPSRLRLQFTATGSLPAVGRVTREYTLDARFAWGERDLPAPHHPTRSAAARNALRESYRRMAQNDAKGALAAAARAIDADDTFAAAFAARAECHTDAGAYESAHADFTRALALRPDVARWCVARARLADHLEAHDPAADLDRAIASIPGLAEAWGLRARIKADRGDPSALADATRALSLAPSRAIAWSDRGDVQRALGRSARAWRDYGRALAIDRRHATAHDGRAEILKARDDTPAAIREMDRAIEIEPTAVRHLTRSRLHQRMGDAANADRDLDEAVRLDPTEPSYLLIRAKRRSFHDLAGAIADATKLVEIDPKRPLFYWVRVGYLLEAGQTRKARADLDRMLELNPTDTDALSQRASLRASKDDHAGAIDDLTKAIGLAPKQGKRYLDRARLRTFVGDIGNAMTDVDRALTLGVDDPSLTLYGIIEALIERRDGNDLRRLAALLSRRRTGSANDELIESACRAANAQVEIEDLAGARTTVEAIVTAWPKAWQGYYERAGVCSAESDALAVEELVRNRDTSKERAAARRAVLADLDRAVRLMTSASKEDLAVVRESRAHHRLAAGDTDGALADLDAVLADPDADDMPTDALRMRIGIHDARGDREKAIADCTTAMKHTDAPWPWRRRAALRAKAGDVAGAIRDLTVLIDRAPSRIDLERRAALRRKAGDVRGADADQARADALRAARRAERARRRAKQK